MAKYKLVKRTNPLKKDQPAKWHATPNSETPLTGKAMTRAATANTTTAPSRWKHHWNFSPSSCPCNSSKDTR